MARRSTRVVLAGAFVAVGLAIPAVGAAPTAAGVPPVATAADGAASASQVARPARGFVGFDAVSVYQTGSMTATVRDAALSAARDAGAPAVEGRGFSIGLAKVLRGGAVVQQSRGAGWGFPMAVSALPPEALAAVMGREVAGVASRGQVVLGRSSADLRGARAGDQLQLMGASGMVNLTVGLVADDLVVGGTEMVMSPTTATLLGATSTTRVLIYGQFDRALLDASLAWRGLSTSTSIRVRRSWDPPDPDDTMGLMATKVQLGEFDLDYANLTTNGWTATSPEWQAAYLPPTRQLYPTGIAAKCNIKVQADLYAALDEINTLYPELINPDDPLVSNESEQYEATTGIDIANTNTAGGCSNGGKARFARITQSLGSVSRHSWGQPLDLSTVANRQGYTPTLDCRIVRVFRKHGFAWGGNFLTPDGMHFEWVGERRDQLPYPSRFCPNEIAPSSVTAAVGDTGWSVLFSDDGLTAD